MKLPNYAPSQNPSLDQQRDALRKGLGRAYQWAETGKLDHKELLDACLSDLRFDHQCEDARGLWLWELVGVLDLVDDFRRPIFASLADLAEHGAQRCQLAGCYAAQGDSAFQEALYVIAQTRPAPLEPWLGEAELLAIEPAMAVTTIAAVRGRELARRPWDWDDEAWLREAEERLGSEQVARLLDTSRHADVIRYREQLREHRPLTEKPIKRSQRLSVAAIIEDAETGDSAYGPFRYWALHAPPAELDLIFDKLLAADEPRVVERYLRLFGARSFPRLHPRLFELCRYDDLQLRRRALRALRNVSDPAVRRFALALLDESPFVWESVQLFRKNYQLGDEAHLLDRIELPPDEDERHWLLMEATHVLENNPAADPSQLGLLAYAELPRSVCRKSAAKLLLARDAAPPWLAHECRHDAAEDIRALVAG